MSSLSYSSAIQNKVARILTGSQYSDLKTDQKALLDGSSSSSPPTAGVAKDAWDAVNSYAQYMALTGSTAAPATWERWFVERMVLLASQQMRPDPSIVAGYEKREAQAKKECIESFARKEFTNSPGSDTEAWAASVQNIRFHVASSLVRRDPPVFVPVEIIDANLQRVLSNLWNGYDWMFKRRSVTMTVTSSSVVSFDLAGGEEFHSFASRMLYYTDTQAQAETTLRWADADEMAKFQAMAAAGYSDGRPERFRFENKAGTLTWTFFPDPDTTYSLRGEVYVKGPGVPSSETSTTVFAKFPEPFHPLIRDLTLVEVMDHQGVPGGERLRARVQDEIERLLPTFAQVGKVDNDQQVRDVYDDRYYQYGWRMWGGL